MARRTIIIDLLVAALLAGALTLAWTISDWPRLSQLILPDTDDMMRLQQVRDWLGGQSFFDLAQHRLGPGAGLRMHWSRLDDLVPAALIAGLAPLIGRAGAELVAVITWPALLFAGCLALIAPIARATTGPGSARTAQVIAALAFPAASLFVPGRIDHHNLQMLLLLTATLPALREPSLSSGLTAGLATTASLVVGLETAPLLAALLATLVVPWLMAVYGSGKRLVGIGAGLIGGLLVAAPLFGGSGWDRPSCDGFTAILWRAALIGSLVPLALGGTGRWIAAPRARLMAAAGIGTVGTIAVIAISPECLHPYAGVDPLLAALWLGRVGEAQPLLAAPAATAVGYAGIVVAGLIATAAAWWRTRRPGWMMLTAVLAASLGLGFLQLRGAYGGAMLAAPGLAWVVGAARRRGTLPLAGAWAVSAGMLYPIAASAIAPAADGRDVPASPCITPRTLAALRTIGRGRLIAPLDLGAYAIGATPLDVLGAPYHRNDAGNLATYRFFLGDADGAERIARSWRATHVAVCAGSFDEIAARPAFLQQLKAGTPPPWLTPVGHVDGMLLYRFTGRRTAD